jgi:hypothetical protein
MDDDNGITSSPALKAWRLTVTVVRYEEASLALIGGSSGPIHI